MPPVDPGSTIAWARTPSYTTSLLAAISAVPSRADQHALFSSATGKSAQWKARKNQTLEGVATAVFSAGGDAAREKKQRESTGRRITQLGKDYSADILSLRADPYRANATLAQIRSTTPHFDALRAILHDHADFASWDEADALDDDDDEGGATEEEENYEDEEEAMEDVQPGYFAPLAAHAPAPAAGPAPQPQPPAPALAAPHQPLPLAPPALGVPPPPAPNANPAAAAPNPALQAHGSGLLLDSCPVCSLPLSGPESANEAHLRACLDGASGGGGAVVMECPVCGLSFEGSGGGGGWTEEKKAKHVDECCNGVVRGAEVGGGRRGKVREHVVFIADEKTAPKDERTGEILECTFCFDPLSPSSSDPLARLSCHCIFHEACIADYWKTPGKWCPVHREMDEVGETEMRG
ncbi:hypothetical protein JCM10213_007751 [Rhodosporidiobolus nylandii]